MQGQRALITGASRGIGKAIALAYAEQGASVVLTATREDSLQRVRQECEAAGAAATVLTCDVTEPQALEGMFRQAVECYDGLDVLVNNAGIYIGKPFTQYSFDEFDRLMKVNVYAVFQLMQLALVQMLLSMASISPKLHKEG